MPSYNFILDRKNAGIITATECIWINLLLLQSTQKKILTKRQLVLLKLNCSSNGKRHILSFGEAFQQRGLEHCIVIEWKLNGQGFTSWHLQTQKVLIILSVALPNFMYFHVSRSNKSKLMVHIVSKCLCYQLSLSCICRCLSGLIIHRAIAFGLFEPGTWVCVYVAPVF